MNWGIDPMGLREEGAARQQQAKRTRRKLKDTQAALALAQAQAARLREALEGMLSLFKRVRDKGSVSQAAVMVAEVDAAAALASPLDTSALDAVRAEEREACAKVCEATVMREPGHRGQWEGYGPLKDDLTGPECAARIRARAVAAEKEGK
jgi:hypothetical protein